MKKLILSLGVFALGAMAFANPPKKKFSPIVNTYLANQSLTSMYGKVGNLSWRACGTDILRSDYVIDGEKFSSFFDLDGNFLATTAFVTMEDMPAPIRNKVKEKLKGIEIIAIVHRTTDSEISYFVETLESGKSKVYRVGANGGISRFQ